MIARGDYTGDPWERIPFQTGTEAYGATGELFADIQLAFREQPAFPTGTARADVLGLFYTAPRCPSSCTKPRDYLIAPEPIHAQAAPDEFLVRHRSGCRAATLK